MQGSPDMELSEIWHHDKKPNEQANKHAKELETDHLFHTLLFHALWAPILYWIVHHFAIWASITIPVKEAHSMLGYRAVWKEQLGTQHWVRTYIHAYIHRHTYIMSIKQNTKQKGYWVGRVTLGDFICKKHSANHKYVCSIHETRGLPIIKAHWTC